ncbi:MAG TPA: hypothetical protein VEW46_04830 [Pyrinomonadaceae bacterium]|nr:hypothetical protein [Pyrinomonadaceae bacterium]
MKRIFAATLFIAGLSIISSSAFAQSESRDDVLKQIEIKRAELAVLEKQILQPSEQDRLAYTDFLSQPKTGIVRLMPREKYDDNAYKDMKKPSVTIRGGGAFYSFSRDSHDYNSGSPEILLERGQLSVGFAGGDYGILTTLGDVPVEQITIEHPSVRFLAEYSVPKEELDARSEGMRFWKGVTFGGGTFKRQAPAAVDVTYALRSINLVGRGVLVVFKVVRQDGDGSVTLVWKQLKTYDKPKFARSN